MSYIDSTGVTSGVPHRTIQALSQQPQAFIEDIDSRVNIPIMERTTHRTNPFTNAQVFDLGVLISTVMTKLTTGIELAHGNGLFPIPFSLIQELPAQLAKRGVTKTFGQLMIFHHILGSQSL